MGHTVTDVAEQMNEAQEILTTDAIFSPTRGPAQSQLRTESQIRETGEATAFSRNVRRRKWPPIRSASPTVAFWNLFEKAFTRENPLFTLPMYYPLHWYKGPDKDIDPFEPESAAASVGLIRTEFLKRFESSVASFELSCARLLKKLLAFVEVHSKTDSEKRRLERWKAQHAEILGYTTTRQMDLWGEEDDEPEDDDIVPVEMLDAVELLDREEYEVEEMISETFLDLDQIVQFLDEAQRFEPSTTTSSRNSSACSSQGACGAESPRLHGIRSHGALPKSQLDAADIEGVLNWTAPPGAPGRGDPALLALLQWPLLDALSDAAAR